MNNDVLVTHSGRQHAYKLALSMQKLGRLSRFVTSAYYDPARFPDKMLSRIPKVDRFLKKRHEAGLSDKVRRFPLFEVPELFLRSLIGNAKLVSDAVCVRDALFDKFVARTQIKNCNILWGFQGSSLFSLKEARNRGITAIVEFATAHVTEAVRILEEEKTRNPEWADSISNLYFPDWYVERLKAEPFSADHCVAASSFSKKTLEMAGVESEKISVLPLGVDTEKFVFRKRKKKALFQALFVGSIGERKGVKYLLEAVKKLDTDRVKLKIIGPIIGSGRAFKSYSGAYEYLGPLSQDKIITHMHESDCLIFPSLFEGFGLVIPEAMSTGMPVIASVNTAAPDIIRNGIDGFLVEPRDIDGISAKLERLAVEREKCISMGEAASKRAKDFSWQAHAARLGKLLKKLNKEEK